ncbi:hypothetical protein AJ87_13710 [Rhizobium yanglingense]|nr:hypothetical protein AJ87_13710 [Rhizobium yanglingense]
MRFAAIADIHGNHLALEAVLADIRAQGISDIVDLGDCFSSPLEAGKTAELLLSLALPTVRGNHDRYLISRSRNTCMLPIKLPISSFYRVISIGCDLCRATSSTKVKSISATRRLRMTISTGWNPSLRRAMCF